ncbi:hypothetical protein [Brevibacillus laterosporus]|nr:hypothetical protein [Brevibacillus laterosporus]
MFDNRKTPTQLEMWIHAKVSVYIPGKGDQQVIHYLISPQI